MNLTTRPIVGPQSHSAAVRCALAALRTCSSVSHLFLVMLAVLTLGGPLSAAALGQTTGWTQRNPTLRGGHTMAFDASRGVTVLFGGSDLAGAPSAETWEWNGSSWTQRAVSGPSARVGHAMAYDSARGVTVLFGGTGAIRNNETWEWSGAGGGTWTQRIVSGPSPSPRYGHAMAYDSARGVTVLFGGFVNGALSGETWEWNGSTWTQRAASAPAPSPRYVHAMAYDAARHVTVLFGGTTVINGAGDGNAETWEWNGAGAGTWTRRVVSGPTARSRHAMAYDATRHVTVLFGGSASAETWEWNGAGGGTWTQRVVSGPSRRDAHAMAFDSARGVTVLFGGYDLNLTYNAETWEWNGSGGGTWSRRGAGSPSSRRGHAMAFDSARAMTLLFGGAINSSGTSQSAQTWEWSGAAGGVWTQRMVTGPSARKDHAMAYDSARGVTVLFGGTSTFTRSAETWEWNGGSGPGGTGGAWTRRMVAGPSARSGHAMVYDSARNVTVLFGGATDTGASAETWEWNGAGAGTWTQRAVSGPAARSGHAMAFDPVRQVTVLFGGMTDTGANAETWEWNGAAWTQHVVSGPSARSGHAMVFDTTRGSTILFGGADGAGTATADAWELSGTDGSTWAPLALAGPSARFGHAMAFDTARDVTVLFGGSTGTVATADTWELALPCAQPTCTDPSSQSACTGGSATFSVSATGTPPFTYQWRKDALAIDSIASPSAATPTLTLTSVTASDAATYDCVVTNPCGTVTSNPAPLTVSATACCPADFSGDGTLDPDDLADYITAFFSIPPPPIADFNGDGTTDPDDLADFLNAFLSGCG